jgi:phage terminase small subunit
MAEKKLTPKQERFVAEYLIDLNATQAATRAGYSARTANEQGARLLANVSVRSAIEASKAKRIERIEITQDRVLLELARIAFFDMRTLYTEEGQLKKPHELDDNAAAVLAGIDTQSTLLGGDDEEGAPSTLVTKKVKVSDKVAALTLAMRHMGMLKDKLEVTGEISLAERMRQQKPPT